MRKYTNWMAAFIAVLCFHVIAIKFHNHLLAQVTKPILVPLVVTFFLLRTADYKSSLKNFILFGLFFSWMGDVLLMFQSKGEIYFLLGLSAFLLAHIFYIFFFFQIKNNHAIKSNIPYLIGVAIFCGGLLYFLFDYLGSMKVPVIIYGIIISAMLWLALHGKFLRIKNAGFHMAIGAALFVFSDAVLAINKFYASFSLAGVIIMCTYGLAQFFIAKGAAEYLEKNKQYK